MGNVKMWDNLEFKVLRECDPATTRNYVIAKISKMANMSLDYIVEVLEDEGQFTRDQALTVLETLTERVKGIFKEDLFIELGMNKARLQGIMILRGENVLSFDIPMSLLDLTESNYLDDMPEHNIQIDLPDIDGTKADISAAITELFGGLEIE